MCRVEVELAVPARVEVGELPNSLRAGKVSKLERRTRGGFGALLGMSEGTLPPR